MIPGPKIGTWGTHHSLFRSGCLVGNYTYFVISTGAQRSGEMTKVGVVAN